MKKTFKVTGLVGFDNLLDQEYKKQFGKNIEILEADIGLIKNGVIVKITTFSNEV